MLSATQIPVPAQTRPREWDDALIPRVAAGEVAAWRTFHRHHFPIVTRFLRKLGVGQPDIEDACQEVFMQVHRYLPRFRGEALIKTWLYRLCITEARSVRRRRWIAKTLVCLTGQATVEVAVPAAGRTDGAVQGLVLQALDQMNERERVAFVLFEMEGLPGKEVAEITGSSLPSVWRQVFQARETLKRALGVEAQ
jgi:RNA polymerase sigma-70 factor (ECF subfamily)